jgi:hypothetical protein
LLQNNALLRIKAFKINDKMAITGN